MGAALKMVRIEPGHYRTPDGNFEVWKADDGIRTHGGPMWIVWEMASGGRIRRGHEASFVLAKKCIGKLLKAQTTP